MANQRAPVDAACEHLVAHLAALRVVLLAALHRTLGASTAALPGDHGVAGGTRTGMTQQAARMLTAVLLSA